jgi:hypothetical protein
MDWQSFRLGFWHPFGPYCGLTGEQIVEWKRDEAQRHGWTLWSFHYAPSAPIWQQILHADQGPIYVLCALTKTGRDPNPEGIDSYASHYRALDDTQWTPMPTRDQMYVTNPFKSRGLATAFVVKSVNMVRPTVPPITVSWYSKGIWRDDMLPTRNQFVIRSGGKAKLRSVAAVLELKFPYLAEIKPATVA